MNDKAIKHLRKDPVLKELIRVVHAMDKAPQAQTGATDVYYALLESIVSQQLSVKAADTIFGRFIALFPQSYPTPEKLVKMKIEKLRAVGLSGQKASYVKNVAEFYLGNDMSYEYLVEMHDDDIIDYLTQIKGVGRWTVEMLLIFVLGKTDVFPYDDLVVRNNLVKLYNVEASGKELKLKCFEIAESWKPHRSLACRYLWRYKDTVSK